MADQNDQKVSKNIAKQIKKNTQDVNAGKIRPQYENLPSLSNDPTNPLVNPSGSDMVADQITNVIAAPNPQSQGAIPKTPKKQSRKELEAIITQVSGRVGIVVETVNIEDLLSIQATLNDGLTERDVYLYLRGVSRTMQTSASSKMEELVRTLSDVLNKSQQTIQNNTDTNRQLNDKITITNSKIDKIIPAISSVVLQESRNIQGEITKVRPQSSASSIASSSGALSSPAPATPDHSQLISMLIQGGCPTTVAEKLAVTISGKVRWEEYNNVMSGNVNKEDLKKLIAAWKLR